MLVTPSQIVLYALAGLFSLYLWVRVFTFPRGKRRQAASIATIFLILMALLAAVFSLLVPWIISLLLKHPFTGLL